MKKDIESRKDIQLLIDTFYQKVLEDEDIGMYFTEVVSVDWEKHIRIMCDFWENVLFFTGTYSGNPMYLHKHINHIHSLESKHFTKWVRLFAETSRDLFSGTNTDRAIRKAESIAAIMEYNILQNKTKPAG